MLSTLWKLFLGDRYCVSMCFRVHVCVLAYVCNALEAVLGGHVLSVCVFLRSCVCLCLCACFRGGSWRTCAWYCVQMSSSVCLVDMCADVPVCMLWLLFLEDMYIILCVYLWCLCFLVLVCMCLCVFVYALEAVLGRHVYDPVCLCACARCVCSISLSLSVYVCMLCLCACARCVCSISLSLSVYVCMYVMFVCMC